MKIDSTLIYQLKYYQFSYSRNVQYCHWILNWQKLSNENIEDNIVKVDKNMYQDAHGFIMADVTLPSNIFKVDIGVRQGDIFRQYF